MALLAVKADTAGGAERWEEAIDISREALAIELDRPGTVMPMPMSTGESVVIGLASVVAWAARETDSPALREAARSLLSETAARLEREGRSAEARVIGRKEFELDPGLRLMDVLGFGVGEGGEGEFDEAASIEATRRLLNEGRFDDAAKALLAGGLGLSHSQEAVPLARALVKKGGAGYASLLRDVALEAGNFSLAVEASELVFDHQKRLGEPPDSRQVQAARCSLAEALAARRRWQKGGGDRESQPKNR